MKLSRLLIGLISLLWVLVFFATLWIVIQSTRDFLQKTLESHAQDTATFLGLAITHSGRVKDVETIDLPRPRHAESPALLAFQRKILSSLGDEISKVMQEELGETIDVPEADAGRPAPDRSLGMHI